MPPKQLQVEVSAGKTLRGDIVSHKDQGLLAVLSTVDSKGLSLGGAISFPVNRIGDVRTLLAGLAKQAGNDVGTNR